MLGLPFRSSGYPCPDCGRQVDPSGIHAMTCSRSGTIARCHTVLRDTLQNVLLKAGLSVAPGQSPPGSSERPADLLVSSWRGLAIDFTVITSTRASASHLASDSTLMDRAADLKIRKSKALCEAAGWEFRPFVADTFGAIRSDGRALVSRVIKRCASQLFPLSEAEAGRAIWSSVAAAVIARVTM